MIASIYRNVMLAAACVAVGSMNIVAATSAETTEWPTKTVRIVVPADAGGLLDASARMLAVEMQKQLNQSVIVENKPGSGGLIGLRYVSNEPANGDTLVLHGDTVVAVDHAYPNVDFNIESDLTPITELSTVPYVLVINPSVPANNLEEFVAYVKDHADSMAIGAANPSDPSLLGWERFRQTLGLPEVRTVYYKGNAPALTATISGETQFMVGSYVTTGGAIEAGQVKPIAVGSPEPIKTLPNVQTFGSYLGDPSFVVDTWSGIWGPKNMPVELAQKIRDAIANAMQTPELRAQLDARSATVAVSETPADYAKLVSDTRVRTIELLKQLHRGIYEK